MAHPQNSHRGLFSKSAIQVGSAGIFSVNYSTGTAAVTFDSTAVANFVGDLSMSGSGKDLAQDSTGVLDLPAGLALSGKGKDLTQNSTGALLIPQNLSMLSAVGATAIIVAANSTGVTIAVGTGAAAQISTA